MTLVYDKVDERWLLYDTNTARVATCYRLRDGRFRVSIEVDAESLSRRELRLLVDALESLLAAEPEP